MKINKTTQVNFGNNKAILENLALALRESQCVALRKLPGFERETKTKLKSLNTCLNQVTQDKSFMRFLDNFNRHLQKPIELKHAPKRRSLVSVASHTAHFDENNQIEDAIRTNGLDIFESKFLAKIKVKFKNSDEQMRTKARDFINALKEAVNQQIKPC